MKKLFFIAWFIACANIATTLLPSQTESTVEQLVHIMMSNTKARNPYTLTEKRNSNDYQDVYNLATKHPELLKGIIHDGRTFAMLCVERGYADLLACLIKEGYPVDLATPCNLLGPDEPQTTVLHRLFREIFKLCIFSDIFSEEYRVCITGLTKLIINKCPDLLDAPVDRARTARQSALSLDLTFSHRGLNISGLIPRDLPQSANDNSV